jgi:hypothetical protein
MKSPDTEPEVSEADAEAFQKIRTMPREIGVLLLVAGVGGLVLPGPFGTPFLVMGGVVLWPNAFERVENYLEKKFPKMHRQSERQINRFVADLERRYPLGK